MKKIPVIIDCDPGIDDAIALLLAFQFPQWDIVGITAVAGNVPVEYTAINAVKICTMAARKIPVYSGAAQPLYRDRKTAEIVHGKNGLGDIEFPAAYEIESESAFSFLKRASFEYENELEIVTMGPMTNLAQVLMTDPGFSERIKKVTLMGGAVYGGNANPVAEFNIYADPEAARICFQAGFDLTMVGLDVTDKAFLPQHMLDSWLNSQNHTLQCAGKVLNTYKTFYDSIGKDGVAMHDPLAIAVAIQPDLVKIEDLYIDVECRSSISRGNTVADWWKTTGKAPNIKAAMEIDVENFMNFLQKHMMAYEEESK